MRKKVSLRILITTISLCVLIGLSFLTSCTFLDNYIVKKQDYDNLKNDRDKISQDYKKQLEATKNLEEENKNLKNENEEKDKTISSLEEELAFKSNLDNYVLKEEYEELCSDYLGEQESIKDLENLRSLINNFNKLLKNVYIGSADPKELAYTFTAFSIEYEGQYYLITAGHCVKDNFGKEGKFKFKANFSDEWIYPELLGYKAEFWNLDDYAVFSSDKLYSGFKISGQETKENYLVGSMDKNLSVLRNLGAGSKRGESGSPVINENGEVVGIYVVYGLVYTPIQLALDKIDNLIK
jgi:cell division protein FtsB